MPHLTPTQKRILQLLPATPGEIAQVLYGRATASEHRPERRPEFIEGLVEGRNLVYVHVALLRRRLTCPEHSRRDGTARITSRPWPPPDEGSIAGWPNPDGYAPRIIYAIDREPNISEGIH